MNKSTQTEIEAAAFRALVEHLQQRTDVQNIDLMNLAGFCRNCLSKWLHKASEQNDAGLDYEQALAQVYGMAYSDWKKAHQTPATAEQLDAFEASKPLHAKISGHS